MSDFSFEAEFTLLDVGATSGMLRAGAVRPTIIGFTGVSGVSAVALDWQSESERDAAFENIRRHLRDNMPEAYALVAHVTRRSDDIIFHLPGETPEAGTEYLAILMFSRSGESRGVLYPVRRINGKISFGMPAVTDAESVQWCPIGDIWRNPYCVGDVVRFQIRERAVEPGTVLWNTVVELTKMRIHEDQAHTNEYMTFLDDLRNGVLVVAGRDPFSPTRVYLKPRTSYNPLGQISSDASRLEMAESVPPALEKVAS